MTLIDLAIEEKQEIGNWKLARLDRTEFPVSISAFSA
jgi:hypothetical protein